VEEKGYGRKRLFIPERFIDSLSPVLHMEFFVDPVNMLPDRASADIYLV
jgi:hypothetical protein